MFVISLKLSTLLTVRMLKNTTLVSMNSTNRHLCIKNRRYALLLFQSHYDIRVCFFCLTKCINLTPKQSLPYSGRDQQAQGWELTGLKISASNCTRPTCLASRYSTTPITRPPSPPSLVPPWPACPSCQRRCDRSRVVMVRPLLLLQRLLLLLLVQLQLWCSHCQ